jgi:uncharacterized protein
MNADFGSWLLGMPLGASALGGMLGMATGIFIVLAATTFGSALIERTRGGNHRSMISAAPPACGNRLGVVCQ